MSKYALGFDGLAHFHEDDRYIDKKLTESFNLHANWPKNLAKPYLDLTAVREIGRAHV